MKPLLMRHSEPINESFKIWRNFQPYHHNPWHYHPECEITYIFKGRGILFVGDKMMEYGNDELVMMGPNLPHEWRSRHVMNTPDLYSESVSIHFNQFFLGDAFYQLAEVAALKDFLAQSVRGIKISDQAVKATLKQIFDELLHTDGIPKIYKLLEVLHVMAVCNDRQYLSSNSFVDSIDQSNNHRINQVYAYVMKHFTKAISIADVAAVINMTPTSFCRFFKDRTHKSFIRYLNEIRVGYACRLLLEGQLSISQVAYESGFGNLSNFNKQFRAIKGINPTVFIKDHFNDFT
ncbi:AraC family transcriptional regulator [Olivibacter ginsenosidimutans]|uniref:AraC family transcriptional regulator n=1 Tax=Olivibacter ginsenosidimutans TaxID=1176537 RepID=A0ABP9AVQ4_9SPHI